LRVIVACVPQTGHILPLLPLAQAYAGRGDEVIIASGPDAAAAVTSRGSRSVPSVRRSVPGSLRFAHERGGTR
jgi:UDP:flavonoid glycosyltransferase YjiC (YdhE family)